MRNKKENIVTRIKVKLDKISTFILFIIFLLLLWSLYRNILKINRARDIVSEAQTKLEKLEQENKDLEAKLDEVSDKYFIEKQIRDKLNLTKEGEIMIILPPEEVLRKLAPKEERVETTLPDPNWKKWAKLFGF